MVSHTGLLTDTSICGFYLGRAETHEAAGRRQKCFFFFLFQVWMRTLLQRTAIATSHLQAFVGTEKRPLCCTNALKTDWTGCTNEGQCGRTDTCKTPARSPRSGAAGAPPTAAAATADKFWGRAEYLQLHFYPQRRRHAALTRTAPAGPVLKAVCNRFLRCTLVL